MTITTRISNRGTAGMNLIDKRTFTVEARDDDTVEALLPGGACNGRGKQDMHARPHQTDRRDAVRAVRKRI